MHYIIKGGNKLEGTVRVSGNKNSVFPCFGAALLTEDEVTLGNIACIKDTEVLIEIIRRLGVRVERSALKVKIKAQALISSSLDEDLMGKLRGSIVLVGALLGRLERVNFYHPGGDVIGKRSIETHLEGFKTLGAKLNKKGLKYSLKLKKNLRTGNREVFLKEASVTATENLILASVLGKWIVILKNCAKEPHVVDLCRMLRSMGAKIEGEGSDTIKIYGVERIKKTEFAPGPDLIEAGTYITASAITGGRLHVLGLDGVSFDPILNVLKSFGVKIEYNEKELIAYPSRLKSCPRLVTNIWPGFPTDFMSVAIVLATQSEGVTCCLDWMYEGRMFFTDKLMMMGAKITLADPHRVLVSGPTNLRGKILDTPDIRAGMALVLGALVAKGKSIINQAELIERGYENVVEKLTSLGADIIRVEV